MPNCHNCGAPVKESARKRNDAIPYYCMARACRTERNRVKGRLQWEKILGTRSNAVNCENCGDTMHARVKPPMYGYFCTKQDCLNARQRKRRVMRKDFTGRDRLNCETCMYQSNCRERVKLGMFVVCETPDKRDELVLELSPERGRMMELIEEARVL